MSLEYQYKVFCTDEQQYFNIWNMRIPMSCPNNNRHKIDAEKTIKINQRYTNVNVVKIQEENTLTNGNYKCKGYQFDISKQGDNLFELTYKYPINILGVTILTNNTHRGDVLNVSVAPGNGNRGKITKDVNIGTSNIPVDCKVLNNAEPGFVTFLQNSSNIDLLGEINDIDYNQNTITVDNATTRQYVNGSDISYNCTFIQDLMFTEPNTYQFGDRKVGSSYIGSGSVIKIKYINNNLQSINNKSINFNIDYLY
jgi:hypothetical protein